MGKGAWEIEKRKNQKKQSSIKFQRLGGKYLKKKRSTATPPHPLIGQKDGETNGTRPKKVSVGKV